jgi:glycosyltransferase involved in cell wall biosynthesis
MVKVNSKSDPTILSQGVLNQFVLVFCIHMKGTKRFQSKPSRIIYFQKLEIFTFSNLLSYYSKHYPRNKAASLNFRKVHIHVQPWMSFNLRSFFQLRYKWKNSIEAAFYIKIITLKIMLLTQP